MRDRFCQYLIKNYHRQIALGEINQSSTLIEYIAPIFERALGSKLSPRELERIESRYIQFEFLKYDDNGSCIYKTIHDISYTLIGLCSGYHKLVQHYTAPWRIFDSELSVKTERCLDHAQTEALCNDVAKLARECIREFSQELRDTGGIMTSTELAKYRQSLLKASNATEDGSYSDDEFEVYTKDASKSAAASETASSGVSEDQKMEASMSITAEEGNNKSNNIIVTQTEDDSKSNALLNHLLSWIYELPKWLLQKFLYSAPILALIESFVQWITQYEVKSIINCAKELFAIDKASNDADTTEDDINAQATIAATYTADQIDMNMILSKPMFSGWILPTIAVGSGNLFGNVEFNGFAQLIEMGGIDLFIH